MLLETNGWQPIKLQEFNAGIYEYLLFLSTHQCNNVGPIVLRITVGNNTGFGVNLIIGVGINVEHYLF